MANVVVIGQSERLLSLSLPHFIAIDGRGLWKGRELICSFRRRWNEPTNLAVADFEGARSIAERGIGEVGTDWRTWLSIFSRWSDRGDKFNLWASQIAAKVLIVAEALQAADAKIGVFLTGVSHHPETLIIEEALRLVGVPQVYLYSVVVSGRLLPLVQSSGLKDRKALDRVISDYDVEEDLERFKQYGALKIDYPTHERSQLLHRSQIAVQVALRSIHASLDLTSSGDRYESGMEADYGVGTYMRHILGARSGGGLLNEYVRKDAAAVSALGSAPGLLIMAHYQPEATTYSEAGVASSHIDLVSGLRAAGWQGPIVYREHPGQRGISQIARHVGMARDSSYYETLRSLDCLFMSSKAAVDDEGLKNRWLTPVTMTGSIALERSLRGNHTLISGNPWFRGVPGALELNADNLTAVANLRQHDSGVAESAFQFIRDILSFRTLTNAPGIGTGYIMGEQEWRRFESEFSILLENLASYSAT